MIYTILVLTCDNHNTNSNNNITIDTHTSNNDKAPTWRPTTASVSWRSWVLSPARVCLTSGFHGRLMSHMSSAAFGQRLASGSSSSAFSSCQEEGHCGTMKYWTASLGARRRGSKGSVCSGGAGLGKAASWGRGSCNLSVHACGARTHRPCTREAPLRWSRWRYSGAASACSCWRLRT